MSTESQGQANARAQATAGRVVCGRCNRTLVFVGPFSDEGEFLGLSAKVKGGPGGGVVTTSWPGKKGVQYSLAHYRDSGQLVIRYRFVCRSPKCRSVTRDRGVLSYLREDELPEAGSIVRTRLP